MNKILKIHACYINVCTKKLIKKTFGCMEKFNERNVSGSTLNDVFKFAETLKLKYQIYLFNDENTYKKIIYKGANRDKKIYLYHFIENKHFICITNPKAFFGKKYYCVHCDNFSYTNKHRCREQCPCCFGRPPCKYDKPSNFDDSLINKNGNMNSDEINLAKRHIQKFCAKCNRYFRSEDCFENHEKITSNVKQTEVTNCERYKICPYCQKFFDKTELLLQEREHKCEEKLCRNCYRYVDYNHNCFIQQIKSKLASKFVLYFFDIECAQNTYFTQYESNHNLKDNKFPHVPNLLVCHRVCHVCVYDEDDEEDCMYCSPRKTVFEGENCVRNFLRYCTIQQSNIPNKNTIVISHNGKFYDMQFIVKELFELDKNADINVILTGKKILRIKYNKFITFIDSFSIIPIGLAKFPSAFNLKNMSKFCYPIYFNCLENYNYIGKIPNVKFYPANEFGGDSKKKFLQWHSQLEKSNYVFNNRVELINYCSNDVDLLRRGCIVFMKNIIDLCEINPFIGIFTLPQLAITIFRAKYMRRNILGLMSYHYSPSKMNSSMIAKKWLCYMSHFIEDESKRQIGNIIMEHKLPDCGFHVDGFNPNTATVLYFHGCLFHEHLNCGFSRNKYSFSSFNQHDNSFYSHKRYQQTLARELRVKDLGYNLISEWECVFSDFLKKNPIVHAKIVQHKFMDIGNERLEPRFAFYGGRTEIFRMYYAIKKSSERIKYLDFNSMYSSVMTFGKYCIGHAKCLRLQ